MPSLTAARVRLVGAVFLGGLIGSALRIAVEALVPVGALPWDTLTVNVAGCLAVGVVLPVLRTSGDLHPLVRPAIIAGIAGAFTTFATLSVEVAAFAREAQLGSAATYLSLSITLGMVAVAIGSRLGRRFA